MELKHIYTVRLLCSVANVSRSGYYKWLARPKSTKYDDLIKILEFEQKKHSGILGYRQMKMLLLNTYQIIINHKTLRKLMKRHGLQAVIRRRKPKFIKNDSCNLVVPNVLNRDFIAAKPNMKYATDITYIPIPNLMVYLSVAYDLYNGEIAAYTISQCPDANLSIDTMEQLSRKFCLEDVIIHSDQGIHYTNHAYHNLLKDNKVTQSMSRRGNCWDNAMVENFFGHFKCECYRIHKKAMRTFEDVVERVVEYISYYNTERAQLKLKGMSPTVYREYYQCTN